VVGIALNTYGTAREVERGASRGFDHYFIKPLDIYRLLGSLDGITVQGSQTTFVTTARKSTCDYFIKGTVP